MVRAACSRTSCAECRGLALCIGRTSPLAQYSSDTLQVAARASDLPIARNRADPRAHTDVRLVGQVHRRKAHQRGAVHARGRDTELADDTVRGTQVFEELE